MNRLIWVDGLKGFLIILVILGHILQVIYGQAVEEDRLWNLIYSFHLPAFMAISGYTYKGISNGNIYKKVSRRFRQLIIPFLVWSIVQYVIYIIYDISRPYGILGIFMIPDLYFWFLWVLFWVYFLMLLFDKASLKMHIPDSVSRIFCCLVLVMVMLFFNPRVLGIQFVSYYFIFFYIGILLSRIKMKHCIKIMCIMTAMLVWFIMAWDWHMHKLPIWLNTIDSPRQSLFIYIYRGITALFGIIGFGGIIKYLTPKFTNTFLSKLGEYSLGIYVIHLVVIRHFITILSEYGIRKTSLLIFVSFVLLTILSYIIVKVLSCNKYACRILLGKI